jgi:SAM-dependent methyltransferase
MDWGEDMPSLEENRILWDRVYDWSQMGEEWSVSWGDSTMQWIHTIFSRIHGFLPVKSVLEIAPGYGRWTRFLLGMCSYYIGVDISVACIKACRETFSTVPHAHFIVNDGKSLEQIPDGCIDFVFSFDSMVHCEKDVLENYLKELARKLRIGGRGFIHHSNMGEYVVNGQLTAPNEHLRATSMTMLHFRDYCQQAGLKCVSQEKISWGQQYLNDGFSLFTKLDPDNDSFSVPTMIVENPQFNREIENAKTMHELYNKGNPRGA